MQQFLAQVELEASLLRLARVGGVELSLMDFDTVDITNLNRQIIATQDTIGRLKAEVMQERIRAINPDIKVNIFIKNF